MCFILIDSSILENKLLYTRVQKAIYNFREYCCHLILGLVANISLKVVPFRSYAAFPTLLPFFKCILEVVFCEGVEHRL
jgi:hypothetical protein